MKLFRLEYTIEGTPRLTFINPHYIVSVYPDHDEDKSYLKTRDGAAYHTLETVYELTDRLEKFQ